MDHVRELRWETGAVLPAHIQPKLSPRENDFFMEYNNLVNDYCSDTMVDLASDLEVLTGCHEKTGYVFACVCVYNVCVYNVCVYNVCIICACVMCV
jgi:hypothetical protein